MSSNPQEFARRVLAAFDAAGLATDEEIGDAEGPSTTTLAKYRKVASGEMTMTEPRGDVMRRIDTAAGWRLGSARALWRNQADPEPPRPSLSEILSARAAGARRSVKTDGPEAYVQWLAERLTEVEERLDLLTQRVELSEGSPRLRNVAKPGGLEPEDGDLNLP